MKSILPIALIVSLLLTSCLGVVQLRGTYSEKPVKSLYSASFDDVWQSVIQAIAEKNLDVGVIEKESGLISSFQAAYTYNTTYEGKNKTPLHPGAYIITHRPNSMDDKMLSRMPSAKYSSMFPFLQLTGRWKIVVRRVGENKTEVTVLLGGFEFIPSKLYENTKYYPQIYSLQNFEKEILDEIESRLE